MIQDDKNTPFDKSTKFDNDDDLQLNFGLIVQ